MIKYSVVIPTRDRFRYLNSAIESCLVSNRNDIEIIVSINGTLLWPEISRQYEPVNDPRVRYILTGRLLSMQNNFNFGISQARGQYVTTLGDDDALLPSAFDFADQFFEEHSTEPLCWFRRPYFWPDYSQQPFSSFKPNTLHFWREVAFGRVKSQPLIEACCSQHVQYHSLPSIYNSFYPSTLLDDLRKSQAVLEGEGTPQSIFLRQTQYVDVFTAYASLLFINSYGTISVPLSLSGISARSNGMAALRQGYGDETKRFIAEQTSEDLSAIGSGPFGQYQTSIIMIYNEACKAFQAYGKLDYLNLPSIDSKAVAKCLISTFIAQEYITQPWHTWDVMKCAFDYGILDSIKQLQQIVTWYTTEYDQQLKQWWEQQGEKQQSTQKLSDNYYIINCEQFNVNSASQAAILYQDCLSGKIDISVK